MIQKKISGETRTVKRDYVENLKTIQYEVPWDEISFDPDEHEIVFYSPKPFPEIEQIITDNLDNIQTVFAREGYRFFFLPDICRQLALGNNSEILDYYNPRTDKIIEHLDEALSYQTIKTALCIPDIIDAPGFIRFKYEDEDFLIFSFRELPIPNETGIVGAVRDYLNIIEKTFILNQIAPDKDDQAEVGVQTADDCFETDVYQIGKEIRERIDKLRAKGFTALAIKKLIGDDSDKPSKLLIDSQYRLYLTDYGNREIKLSPLHKAVFFLFLRHPEGIYFKDLGSYREELQSIYEEITGRDDPSAIKESINKLTDPFDNSINEKCARIKNAFVSEFREEVAQWYFIDGKKGKRKGIKLPRELVTWEIKD